MFWNVLSGMLVAAVVFQSSVESNPWRLSSPSPTSTKDKGTSSSSGLGKVEFSFTPCMRAMGLVFSNGSVVYNIWSGADNWLPNWSTGRNLIWRSKSTAAFHQTFSAPPGAYSYEVFANHGQRPSEREFVSCSFYYYVVVLPRSVRRISETLYEGTADPIPKVFVYGVAPASADVSVLRYPSNPECGATLQGLNGNLLPVERDAVGYYASDSYLSNDRANRAVFGVKVVQKGSAEPRIFRVVADYPDSIVSIVPTSARLDVTPALTDLKAPSGVLLCP